jgi:hypothetical protein
MSLPPRGFGGRGEHAVALDRRGGSAWAARVDGRLLGDDFESERAARRAAVAEKLRLDATAQALLRRIRRGLLRKLP